MATSAGLLAQKHMADQVRQATAVQAGLSAAFDKGLNPANLDASYPIYLRSALSVVSAGHGLGVKTATDYYGAAKRGAGYDSIVPLIPTPQLNIAEAAQTLLMTGPVSIKKQLSSGVGLYSAVQRAREQTLGAGKRLALSGGRQQLINLTKSDKDAVAWARVSDGQPCYFCAMLVSRGPVYKADTAHFKAHNRCGCSVRPVFKDDPDGGWSPDAKALNDLWTGKFDPDRPAFSTLTINEWRGYYGKAVADPSSDVFKTFTTKVAKHISDPAIVAARKAASEAWDAQRAIQLAAQDKAKDAATLAAQKAAEAEALAAAKEAAKIKKWQGKPAPVKPIEPKPASTLGEAAFDPWLAKVKDRYTAFATKTGNPKTQLEQSLNWSHVQKVIKSHDEAALTFLKSNQYIDDALYKEAKDAMKLADAPIPGAAAAYKRELTAYRNRLTRHKRYMEEWREVNGVTTMAKGLENAKTFTTNSEAMDWAAKNIAETPRGAKESLVHYTSNAYGPWNRALRDHADPLTPPPGAFKDHTLKADKGFVPAPSDFVVGRGTGWNEFAFQDGSRPFRVPPPPPEDLVGTVQTQHGYTSTAMSGENSNSSFSGEVQMKIMVPEGYPVSYAERYSRYKGERETLIARSTNYYIHAVYPSPNGHHYIVEAEIIPKGVDPAEWAAGASPLPRSTPFR